MTKTKKAFPPTVEEVINFCQSKGFDEALARKVHDYYDVADWKDSHGKPVLSWKQKLIAVWFKDENRPKNNSNVNRTNNQTTGDSKRDSANSALDEVFGRFQ